MKALDTNVLVRLLVKDDPRQGEKIRGLLQRAQEEKSSFSVTLLVLLELLWVLDAVYGIERGLIIEAIESLSLTPALQFERSEVVRRFVDLAKESGLELPDLLIGLTAKESGCESTLTFDRRAARSDLFEIL